MRLFIFVFVGLIAATPAWAGDDLAAVLARVVQTNPELAAERARLSAAYELSPIARAGFLPSVTADGAYAYQRQKKSGETDTTKPASAGINVTQPLFRGFGTVAGMERAGAQITAAEARYSAAESRILLASIQAYLNVATDAFLLDLNMRNEQRLNKQFASADARFKVGELTRTDVAQAKSRLAGASAARIGAEGQLNIARAAYERLIGEPPASITMPTNLPRFDADFATVKTIAMANNSDLRASDFDAAAASAKIREVRAGLLPRIDATAGVGRSRNRSGLVDSRWANNANVGAQISIPIFEAGLTRAQTRQAESDSVTASQLADAQRRQLVDDLVTAWQNVETFRAQADAYQSAAEASELALKGVEQENKVGLRTIIDVLDAEQEYLTTRVELVQAERDLTLAHFQLLSLLGGLNAKNLGLPGVKRDMSDSRDVPTAGN